MRRGLSATDAEDLAATCVTDISLKVEKYKPIKDKSFTGWVFTLARNALADWWRSHNETLPLIENIAYNTHQDQSGLDINVLYAVRDSIGMLSETDQILINLRDMGSELSYAEIAKELNISLEAARVRHFRAIKRLKGLLEADPRITRSQRSRGSRSEEDSI